MGTENAVELCEDMNATETNTDVDALWNDSDFFHAYRLVSGRWDGGESLCGYKGPGPKFLNGTIPQNACPICVALKLERDKTP